MGNVHTLVIINSADMPGVLQDGWNILEYFKEIKWKPTVLLNLDRDELLKQVTAIKTDAKYVLIVYSGHGGYVSDAHQGFFNTNDRKKVLLSEVMTSFVGKEVHVIFDACQTLKTSDIQPQVVGRKFVIAYAVGRGEKAHTDHNHGSPFINAFLAIFRKFGVKEYNQEVFLCYTSLAIEEYKKTTFRGEQPRVCMPGRLNSDMSRGTALQQSGEIAALKKQLVSIPIEDLRLIIMKMMEGKTLVEIMRKFKDNTHAHTLLEKGKVHTQILLKFDHQTWCDVESELRTADATDAKFLNHIIDDWLMGKPINSTNHYGSKRAPTLLTLLRTLS